MRTPYIKTITSQSFYKVKDEDFSNYIISENCDNIKERTSTIINCAGDVLYHPKKEDKKTDIKIIFKNHGNVHCDIYPKMKFIALKNEGNSYINLYGNPCATLFANGKGDVHIKSQSSKQKYIGIIYLTNEGDVYISDLYELSERIIITNKGNVFIDSVNLLSNGITINNEGNVYLSNIKSIEGKITFANSGNVVISKSPKLYIDGPIFQNYKDVIISIEKDTQIIAGTCFKQSGGLKIIGGESLIIQNTKIENSGTLELKDIKNLYPKNNSIISNKLNAYLYSLENIIGYIEISNNGGCYINKLKCARNTTFKNGGNIYAKSLFLNDEIAKPNIFCGKSLIINEDDCTHLAKNIAPSGIIKTQDSTYYSNLSYIKRYNIPVNNGKIILYKAVQKYTRMAKYDNSDVRWGVGDIITVNNWNPYDNEIGDGKFVASYDPKVFLSILKLSNVIFLSIEIDILDLFEYPFGKYPQIIGFRKGKVLNIVNKNKKVMTQKYQFTKEFYDYMNNIPDKKDKEYYGIWILNEAKTNKTYLEQKYGKRVKNPFHEKIYKYIFITGQYGLNYVEERKKVEPDYVPDTKRGVYLPIPENPLLSYCEGTKNYLLSVVNGEPQTIEYYYKDEDGSIKPWNEEEFGKPQFYLPDPPKNKRDQEAEDSDKPKLDIFYIKYKAKNIIKIARINKPENGEIAIDKVFINDDFENKNNFSL